MNTKTVIKLLATYLVVSNAYMAESQSEETLSEQVKRELIDETESPKTTTVVHERQVVSSSPRLVVAPPQQQPQYQQQPTTFVQASPISESKAEQLRRIRQDAEVNTEKKIVEKLESSRLDDEKRRADKLFGDRLDNLSAQPPAQQAPLRPAYVDNQQPVVAVGNDNESDEVDLAKEREEIKSEVMSAVREEMNQVNQEVEVEENTYFMSGMIGSTEYPDAVNISSNTSVGFSIGQVNPEQRMIIQGGFIFSNFYVNEFTSFKELDQYNFNVAVKYMLLTGRVKPVVGAVASYTYRKYKDLLASGFQRNTGFRSFNLTDGQDSTTDSFDIGLVTGVDLEVTKTFAVGVDFRYMTNITNKTDADFFREVYYDARTPVEEVDYYVFNIMGRINF